MKTALKFAPALAMLAAFCAQTPAQAQTQKIATINMQQALAETADGKKAVADLRSKFGPKDQDFQRRSQELQATQEKLRKTQNTISEEAKAKLEADIAAMTRNLQRDSDDARPGGPLPRVMGRLARLRRHLSLPAAAHPAAVWRHFGSGIARRAGRFAEGEGGGIDSGDVRPDHGPGREFRGGFRRSMASICP